MLFLTPLSVLSPTSWAPPPDGPVQAFSEGGSRKGPPEWNPCTAPPGLSQELPALPMTGWIITPHRAHRPLCLIFLWDPTWVEPVWQHCSSLQDWLDLMKDASTNLSRQQFSLLLEVCFCVSGWTAFGFLILFLWLFSVVICNFLNQESLNTMHMLVQTMPWQLPFWCTSSSLYGDVG